jgi:hypothetical protein
MARVLRLHTKLARGIRLNTKLRLVGAAAQRRPPSCLCNPTCSRALPGVYARASHKLLYTSLSVARPLGVFAALAWMSKCSCTMCVM